MASPETQDLGTRQRDRERERERGREGGRVSIVPVVPLLLASLSNEKANTHAHGFPSSHTQNNQITLHKCFQ